MDDGYWPLSFILFFVFVVLEAMFYGFGAAVKNMNESSLEREAELGSRRAKKLLRIINRPSGFVNSVQVTTTIISMVTGAFILKQWSWGLETVLAQAGHMKGFGPQLLGAFGIGVVLLVCLVSFGIMIPKWHAVKEPEKWAYALVPFITALEVPLLPFTWIVTRVSFVVLKMFGIDMNAEDDNVTEEDIVSMVNEGHEQGVLEAKEAEMITNIFEMSDKDAGDIMTHRTNLVAIDGAETLQDVLDFILKEGKNSRYPVYEKDVDDIIGLLHMKDAVIFRENEEWRDKPVGQIPGLLREAHFIPETRNIDSLFREMQSQKIHMEIVVDEYGQTAGIVTMEDILEEIVGNILDEYDAEEEHIQTLEGSFVLDGLTPLEEAADALGIEFTQEEQDSYDTLNGFLISKLDRIPKEGEKLEVEYGEYLFKILSVENKMIHLVKAEKAEKEERTEE